MTKLQSEIIDLKSDLKKLRVLLIILTLFHFGYLIVVFTDPKLWLKLDYDYKANWLILGLHLIVAGIFIWFNWKKNAYSKKN